MPRAAKAFFVCFMGAALSVMFCTNWGWVVMDILDHYISDYVILSIGLLQQISVGWLWEYDTTAALSEGHAKALRA